MWPRTEQYASIREPVDAMLRIYIARNGEYRVEPLMEAGYHAQGDSMDWLLAITHCRKRSSQCVDHDSAERNGLPRIKSSQILAHIVELDGARPRTSLEKTVYGA